MQKWWYEHVTVERGKVVSGNGTKLKPDQMSDVFNYLDGAGKLGWELVSAVAVGESITLFLKRPVEQLPPKK